MPKYILVFLRFTIYIHLFFVSLGTPISAANVEDPGMMTVTKKQKNEFMSELKALKETKVTDSGGVVSAAMKAIDASITFAVRNQCTIDLLSTKNNLYAQMMNDISEELEDPLDVRVTNDNPIWTSALLASILYIHELKTEINTSPIPFGKCTTDTSNRLRCDASILPYILTFLEPSDPTVFTKYYSEIPKKYCLDQGGEIVHSSFTTDCLSKYNLIPEKEVEVFAIPQCLPATCSLDTAINAWSEHIQLDLAEYKKMTLDKQGFTNVECSITFKVDTGSFNSTKKPKSPKSPKSTKSPKSPKASSSSKAGKGGKSSKGSSKSGSKKAKSRLLRAVRRTMEE